MLVSGLLCGGQAATSASAEPNNAKPIKAIELTNSQLTIRFDAANGSVAAIQNRALGVDYTMGAPAPGLFRLKHLIGDTNKQLRESAPDSITLLGHQLTRQVAAQSLRLDYRLTSSGGGTVQVTCQVVLPNAGDEARWTITVDNQTQDMEIVEVVFPVLGGLRIGQECSNNVLAWPAWKGGLIVNPQKDGKRSGNYAGGGATMAWADLYAPMQRPVAGEEPSACGLYLACYDPTLLMAGLASQPSRDGKSLTLQMSKYAHVTKGTRWASPEFVTRVHAGDWHTGADSYRTWFGTWAPRPNPPAWLKQCDGRLEWTLPLDGKGRFEKDIPEKMALAKQYGLNFARFGGQMISSVTAGKHRCNRLPFPDPLMGTESEFAAVIQKVRQQGGHAAFYINGQAWDPRWPQVPSECSGKIPSDVRIPDWKIGFKESALHHYDGTFYGQYPRASGHWPAPAADSPYKYLFFFMCPATEGWQNHLRYWTVEKYVKQYGTDAMFLDQIGAETAKYCYNPAHAHTHHGVWTQGFMALAKRIKEEARRIDPDFALETEGFGDAYAAYFDSFFIAPASTGIWPDSHPEIARYTFPENIFFDGFWRIQNSGNLRSAAETLNEVFLIGNRFLVYAERANLTPHTVQVVNLRRRIKHVLYAARFMDNQGVATSDERVRAKRFVLDQPDRRVTLLTIYNHDRVAGTKLRADLGALGPVREAAVLTLDGELVNVTPVSSGRQVSLDVPEAVLSAVILVHNGTGILDAARRAEQVPLNLSQQDQ